MTIYIVIQYIHTSCCLVEGVFSTYEKAKEAVEEYKLNFIRGQYEIIERTVDKMYE